MTSHQGTPYFPSDIPGPSPVPGPGVPSGRWTCRSSTTGSSAFADLAKGRFSKATRKNLQDRPGRSSIFPSSGQRGRLGRPRIVNTLSPGRQGADGRDRPFSPTPVAARMAGALGHRGRPSCRGDWRHGADLPPRSEGPAWRQDTSHAIKAVIGWCTMKPPPGGHQPASGGIRAAMDRVGPSSACSWSTPSPRSARLITGHDEWGRSTSPSACSQKKGFMLPAGARLQRGSSDKARGRRREKPNRMPRRSYWGWGGRCFNKPNGERASFPTRPPTNLLYGLREAIAMLLEEGLEAVFRPSTSASRPRPPRGGAALGPRGAVPGAFRIFTGAHRRADAAGARLPTKFRQNRGSTNYNIVARLRP